MVFQLEGSKQVEPGKGMTSEAAFAMAVEQEAVDAVAPLLVGPIVGSGEREAPQDPELGLDQVEPRGIGRDE